MLSNGDRLQAARDFLIRYRTDPATATAGFAWPRFDHFNFAFDWFDRIAERSDAVALAIASPQGHKSWSYRDLSLASNRVAHFLRRHGLGSGDRLLVALGNRVELWETQLGAMKAGCVIVPCTVMLDAAELRERMARSGARAIIADDSIAGRLGAPDTGWTSFSVDTPRPGWIAYGEAYGEPASFVPDRPTRGADPLLVYFTSGTTAQPKMVTHSHVSYPVGHLSTLYWIGLKPGDTHLNISSPGWAKHAWSSFYAPWLAEASILAIDQPAFDARFVLDQIRDHGVDCFCAPPTVWRMLLQEGIERWPVRLREAVSAGEPLNPHVVEQVRKAWAIDVRDGYGQTETTAQIGNTPGQPLVAGAMGRPLPGFRIELDGAAGHGEIVLRATDMAAGVMLGLQAEAGAALQPPPGGIHRTGDIASAAPDGTLTYIGRADDVFKSSDYRISPFEVESILLEHPAVAESAVIPSPDDTRLSVPKAIIALAPGHSPTTETAAAIFAHSRARLAPYKRIRRLEFGELPKTVSGKTRHAQLRERETGSRPEGEYREEDFGPRGVNASRSG
nr:AMP-binding protein [Sphingomonas sp. Y57]